MKKIHLIKCFIAFNLFVIAPSVAQTTNISTIAGTGGSGLSGDGGPASAASFLDPEDITRDAAGNIYICDAGTSAIRKINTAGIISTIAGNGTAGFSGDGGPATDAALYFPCGIAVDGAGNVYIADQVNYRIRKVNTAGIITTVAGNGIDTYSGDGGPATDASIGQPSSLVVDAAGNLYITAGLWYIRKVDPSGTITTIAGTGSVGYGGDGGPATAATIGFPKNIAVDAFSNIYFSDYYNNRIRKISNTGIMSTIAGNGSTAYAGDGGPATDAGIYNPQGLALDPAGNLIISDNVYNVVRKVDHAGIITKIAGTGVAGFSGDGGPAMAAQLYNNISVCTGHFSDIYVMDMGNDRVRKFGEAPSCSSDSFSLTIFKDCSGLNVTVFTNYYAPGRSVITEFGDGTSLTTPVGVTYTGTGGYASVNHAYNYNGAYTVKQKLMSGTSVIDSVSFLFDYKMCNSISVNYYVDENADCAYEPATDRNVFLPVKVEIDSNGTPVDTLETPGGFYYNAYGAGNDVYTIRVIGLPPGLELACPSSGIVYDTLHPALDSSVAVNNIGFNCLTGTSFDLGVHATSVSGRHSFMADIVVDNLYCTPEPATLTTVISPKYNFSGSSLSPATVSGSTVTWNFGSLTSGSLSPSYIHLTAEVPGVWCMPGDTANSQYTINPVTGDINPANNCVVRNDTITGSWDPNYIAVSPNGCIPSTATPLQYAIGFENTGNDTAHNIFILDTLPASLDASTLKVDVASANMVLTKSRFGEQTILKFDFPNIMLPDSTHHNLCSGVLFFTVNTKSGLPDGAVVNNRAGIYFDDNGVVMTNAATNIVNCPGSLQTLQPRLPQIMVYPNPANNELMIVTGNSPFNSFTITNQLGQVILQGQLSGTRNQVDISSFAAGMYFISLSGDAGSKVLKFVKE